MEPFGDIIDHLTAKGYRPLRPQAGHGYRSILRMKKEFPRADRPDIHVSITAWATGDTYKAWAEVYEIEYRRTQSSRRADWLSHKKYETASGGDLRSTCSGLAAAIDQAEKEAEFRMLDENNAEFRIKTSPTPEQVAIRDSIAKSMEIVNRNRRK